jgi:DNA-binding MarR family transcriptional regulator
MPTLPERRQRPASVDGRTLELLHLLRAISMPSRPTRGLAGLLRGAGGALGPRHLPLLLMLSLEENLTVGELASRVGLAPATTSMLANELNRAGLLLRREDEDDRRRTILGVSEQHRAVIEDHARLRIAPLQRALARLGDRGADQLLAALRVLATELEAEGSAEGCC